MYIQKIVLSLHAKSSLQFGLDKVNNMIDRIEHSGIIDAIEDNCVKVRILQTSACASCKVAGYCNASENKEKIIDVYGFSGTNVLNKGDHVTVVASRQVATKALLLAFGVPFIILIVVLVWANSVTSDEILVAFISVFSLVPYFFALYLLRDRIRNNMVFSIEKN